MIGQGKTGVNGHTDNFVAVDFIDSLVSVGNRWAFQR